MSVTTHREFRVGMEGADVERFQRALVRRLRARGEDGRADRIVADGEVGPVTASAAKRALYLLGVRPESYNRAGHGHISEAAQRLVIDPSRRNPDQLERARKRMAAKKRHDQVSAGAKGVKVCTVAAKLALEHAPEVHYTQGGLRWQGINRKDIAAQGDFPNYADCSSFYTWCLWQLLKDGPDVVNGADWQAGYTGTLLTHGRRLNGDVEGAAALYGNGWPGKHVAYCLGNGMVISHGSEGGPYLLPLHYRSDLMEIRAYL